MGAHCPAEHQPQPRSSLSQCRRPLLGRPESCDESVVVVDDPVSAASPKRVGYERSDSCSSVKEDLGAGEPQSFVASKPARDDAGRQGAAWPPPLQSARQSSAAFQQRGQSPHGRSLDSLPAEILNHILTNLALDVPPSDYSPRNRDLVACLVTSRRMQRATEAVLYRRVTLPHARVFGKFLRTLEAEPELGQLTRRLDLSHFTSLGLQQARSDLSGNAFNQATFRRCLEFLPDLREALLQEHIDEEVDADILRKILLGSPLLHAVDLCGMSRSPFVAAFSATMATAIAEDYVFGNLQNLSLHECGSIPAVDLEALLVRVPRLGMLDLFRTAVTDTALLSIPRSAQLTHLNLGRCSQITGRGVTEFFRTHPAVQHLVYLNLGCDPSRYCLLQERDVDELLPMLIPMNLHSLNLNGATILPKHLPLLLKLTGHLEELGISSSKLSGEQVCQLLASPRSSGSPKTRGLRYVDCTAMASLKGVEQFSVLLEALRARGDLLEVIEISEMVGLALAKAAGLNKRLGWTVKSFGRRCWYVSHHSSPSPGREWKMGSQWWGMLKVPVAWSDVGGIYGHYMFKAR